MTLEGSSSIIIISGSSIVNMRIFVINSGLNSELPDYISIQALLRLILHERKPSLSDSLVRIVVVFS